MVKGEYRASRKAAARKLSHILACALLAAGAALSGCAHRTGAEAGWITLIDGPLGLDNWNRIGDANWRSEEGVIVADAGKGGYLVSKSAYGDFRVRAEFWADHATNSGIFFRLSDPAKINSKNALEMNIYDQSPDPSYGTGAIVNVAPVSPMPTAGGRWNTCEITAKGPELTVVLNGTRTVSVKDGRFAQGPIALQYRKGPIKWRKVQIRGL